MPTLFRRIVLAAVLIGASSASLADPQALFEEAMLERQDGDLYKSISLFEQVLAEDPKLHRARLELAVARYLALNFKSARALATQVSEDPATPDSVRARISTFLVRVRDASKPHKLETGIGIGLVYDTNANAGPEESTIELIDDFTLILSSSANPKEDWAVEMDAWLSHRYLFPGTTRIGKHDAAVAWVTRVSADLRKYFKHDEENLDIFSVQTGPLFIVARRWRGAINLVGHHLRRGEAPYANFIGINPVVVIDAGRRDSNIRLAALAQQRRYERGSDQILEGHLYSFTASTRRVLRNDKYSITPAASVFREDTRSDIFANQGVRLSVLGEAQVKPTDLVFLYISHRWADFDDVHPLFGTARKDRTWRAVLGWEHEIQRSRLKGFTLVSSLSYSKRRSNIDLYDYSRLQAAVSLKKGWK